MRKNLHHILFVTATIFSFLSSNAQCYEQLKGHGLYLFSPVTTRLSSYKQVSGKHWGDSVYKSCPAIGPVYWKWVAPAYIVEPGAAIYAAHSGILRVHTTGGNNFANDACWIDGGEISTAYFHMFSSVSTNQWVYAGQRIGTVIPRKDTTFIYFSIRMSNAICPTMQRATLPAAGDKNCMCGVDPVWPEYFVNPAGWSIYYDYNDTDPKTKLSVNISPAWTGKWSFDNGQTWLNSGESVAGLPQKYYKIIFKEKKEWKTPLPIEVKSTDTKSEFDFSVTYESEKYVPVITAIINPKPVITSNIVDSSSLLAAFDSIRKKASDSSYAAVRSLFYKAFNDSLKSKISNIESEQKKVENKNRLLFIVLPLALLLGLGLIAFYFQYHRLRKQKKHVEELQKELHHRVRNNLSIISALIDESDKGVDAELHTKELESRIKSIGFVHEQLYQQNDITKLNLQLFLEKLCNNLVNTFGDKEKVAYQVNAPLLIETKLATQLALVTAELITNSLKYSIKSGIQQSIRISAKLLSDQKITIAVADNGKGFPEGFDSSLINSYGIRMIKGLIKQMKGEIKFYNSNGSCAEFTF